MKKVSNKESGPMCGTGDKEQEGFGWEGEVFEFPARQKIQDNFARDSFSITRKGTIHP
jgi:hypothetical protein